MPGVDDDLATAALAHVQDARHEPAGTRHEGTAGLDGETGRPAILPGPRRAAPGSSRANRSGPGRRLVERQDREAATDVERVEARRPAAQEADDREPAPDGVAPGIDGPELRPDVEVDPARPDRPAAVLAEPLDERGRLGLGHPELRAAVADRQPGDASRGRHPG